MNPGLINRQQQLTSWINQYTEFDCDSLQMVSGDASFRRYFRFESTGKSIIAVDAPPENEDCGLFIRMAKSYSQHGVKVPDIYAYDLVQGFYCQQDFGDNLFSDELNLSTADNLYKKALDCLPSIQSCQSIDQKPLPIFDRAMVEREFLLFTDWLLNKYLALELTSEQRLMVQDSLDIISHQFLSQPTAGVHRDYHSRNLMLLVNNEVGVIDFQDAVIGPITYDAVSLLRDCYQAWPVEKVVQWLKAWHQTNFSEYDWAQFLVWFDFTGLQRHIKASGIFARLYLRDNKSVYLGDIPRTLQYIIDIAAKYPQLRPFSEFVASVVLPAVRSQREK